MLGVRKLRKGTPLVPEQAIEEAKLTSEALRNGKTDEETIRGEIRTERAELAEARSATLRGAIREAKTVGSKLRVEAGARDRRRGRGSASSRPAASARPAACSARRRCSTDGRRPSKRSSTGRSDSQPETVNERRSFAFQRTAEA